jgi:hypothetical protein
VNGLLTAYLNPREMVNDILRKHTRPVQPTPLDWAANYTMQARGCSWLEARRIVADVLARQRAGLLLTDQDERVWEAFDRAAQESR